MFSIVAAWTAALAALYRLGPVGLAIAALIGAAATLLIVSIRDRKGALSAIIAGLGSLIGAGFANLFFVPPIVNRYDIKDFARDFVIMSIGALIGGIFFSWASKR